MLTDRRVIVSVKIEDVGSCNQLRVVNTNSPPDSPLTKLQQTKNPVNIHSLVIILTSTFQVSGSSD